MPPEGRAARVRRDAHARVTLEIAVFAGRLPSNFAHDAMALAVPQPFVEHVLVQILGEGTDVKGNGPSPLGQSRTGEDARPSAAQAMYPHLPSAGR